MKNKAFHLITTILSIGFSSYSFANSAPFVLETQSAARGYETNIIIKSKSDNLIIQDLIVNRGNCGVELPAIYGVINGQSLRQVLEKMPSREGLKERAKRLSASQYLTENDYQRIQKMAEPPQIGFGRQYVIRAGCKAQDILEISIETSEGSWSFGQ